MQVGRAFVNVAALKPAALKLTALELDVLPVWVEHNLIKAHPRWAG